MYVFMYVFVFVFVFVLCCMNACVYVHVCMCACVCLCTCGCAALPKVMINVRTSVQTVMVGSMVEFECQAEGHPPPTLRWTKVGGALPAHAQLKGGKLSESSLWN